MFVIFSYTNVKNILHIVKFILHFNENKKPQKNFSGFYNLLNSHYLYYLKSFMQKVNPDKTITNIIVIFFLVNYFFCVFFAV